MTTKRRRATMRLRLARMILFAALCVIVSAPLTHAQVSLATVVDLAEKNSAQVRVAQADLAKAQSSLNQVFDAYIPNVTLGSQVGYSYGFPTGQPSVGSASVNSLVFSLSQNQYMKAAKAGVEAANASVKDAEEQAALEAAEDYIELDSIEQRLQAAKQEADFSQKLTTIAESRAEAGVDSELDLHKAQLTAAELRLAELHLEEQKATLVAQLARLTGLPAETIATVGESIPAVPEVRAKEIKVVNLAGAKAADLLAQSKAYQASGDSKQWRFPQIGFGAIYNYDSNELNNYTTYYNHFTPNNLSFGLQFQLPLLDFSVRAKARASAAEALRAKVEAEEAHRLNDVRIAGLNASLRELDAQAEVAGLKQQIASDELKATLLELEVGNGASSGPNAQPQPNPKAEQLARIQERQKFAESLEAKLALEKARLELLRALGHIGDWLSTLNAK